MIIVDDAYVSVRMKQYMNDTHARVLESDMSRSIAQEYPGIELVSDEEAARAIRAGEPVFASSESHFWWLDKHVPDTDLARLVSLCKDKAAMRTRLKPLFPDFVFQQFSLAELLSTSYDLAWGECIVKPNVGFLSMGIYPISNAPEWEAMQKSVGSASESWGDAYDESVITADSFIVESCIRGVEYAVDAYFDEAGEVHILNLMRHDFASAEDTADRLYYTGKAVFDEIYDPMYEFLMNMARLCEMRSFPVHAEVRRTPEGVVIPIEINPLRFAGLGGTEVTKFAYGFFTYDYYLTHKTPTPEEICAAADDDALYCMSVIAPDNMPDRPISFDYEAFAQQFTNVYAFDRFDYATSGIFGFMFWKARATDAREREYLLKVDIEEFITYDA